MASIESIMANTQTANWIWTDDFTFEFINKNISLPGFQGFSPSEIWDMCTINVDTPQISATPNTVIIGGRYRYWVPMHSPINITVTFRDLKGMDLKEYFTKVWQSQLTGYYDNIISTIDVRDAYEKSIFHSDKILIDNISQSQFNNSNTQITEFSVSFITAEFDTGSVQNIGIENG